MVVISIVNHVRIPSSALKSLELLTGIVVEPAFGVTDVALDRSLAAAVADAGKHFEQTGNSRVFVTRAISLDLPQFLYRGWDCSLTFIRQRANRVVLTFCNSAATAKALDEPSNPFGLRSS